MIREAVSDLPAGNEVRTEIKVPKDLGMVNIDEGQVKQALMHILRNALEAMPHGGLMEVSAVHSFIDGESVFLAPGEYVHIRVKDSGIGLQSTEADHVFEPYFTTKQDHSGMGLAVAYSVVKAHNGNISIESDIETGTTVHIYLPSMNPEKPVEMRSEKAPILKNHLKVLVRTMR
jgi:signal transduction histidine kinase